MNAMKPTVSIVEDLTKETMRFELGGLIDTLIENVHILLEEDGVDGKTLTPEEGDLIIKTVIDTVRNEIGRADEFI